MLQFRHCAQYTATHTRPLDVVGLERTRGEVEMHDLSYGVNFTIKWVDFGGPTVLPFVFSYRFMFLDVWACVKVMKLGVDTYLRT